MGKYSHTGLAYGTQGSPQITIDENIYSMKITEISNQLQLNLEQSVKSSSRTFATKKHQHKNIMDKIIFLILSMGYEEIIIGNTIMYIKDNIIGKYSGNYDTIEKIKEYLSSNYGKIISVENSGYSFVGLGWIFKQFKI